MKPTFLSKAFGTFGLIAAITIAASTGIQRTAQAQPADINVPTDIDDEACLASGLNDFYVLQNIDFSVDQLEQVYNIQSEYAKAAEQQLASFPNEDDLGGGYAFVTRPGVEIPPDIQAEMDAASMKVTSGEAVRGQIAALNEQFGQYGEYGTGKKVILTPERRAEIRQLDADYKARYVTVLTPQQQQQYQENLATLGRINEACGIVVVESDRSSFEFNLGFEPTLF